MVRTLTIGTSGTTDQTACRICVSRLSEPARSVRITYTEPRCTNFSLPQKLFITTGQ